MTKEEKQLLLEDLCGRLPYYTELYSNVADGNWAILTPVVISNLMSPTDKLVIKPYLRPMNSMTDEERLYFYRNSSKTYILVDEKNIITKPFYVYTIHLIDYLNAHHFDYRGLIEKGLAVEAPEGMYESKNNI